VLDGRELSQTVLELLTNRSLADKMGRQAAAIVAENRGAAVRTVEQLRQILARQEELA